MKRHLFSLSVLAACLLAGSAVAATNTFVFQNLNLTIPDGDPLGVVDSRILEIPEPYVRSLTVSLDISGVEGDGWVGDLYVSLQHGSGVSVLLNRVGVHAGDAFGSPASAIQIQLATGNTGDIHSYDALLAPGEPYPATITGAFQADGRLVDPLAVDLTSPRTAGLDAFQGLPVGGSWSLFLSDVVSGSVMRLNSWSLTVESSAQPIPESSTWGAIALTLAGVGTALWRGIRRRSDASADASAPTPRGPSNRES